MDAIERVMNNVKILYVEDEAITQIIVKKNIKKKFQVNYILLKMAKKALNYLRYIDQI